MKYFYTADLHLGHKEVIDFCNRPFRSVEGMDYALIQRWNSRVKPEDTVFVIGDFCMNTNREKAENYLKQLNGNKILINGSHDKNNGVKTIIESLQIKYGGKYINLVHDPKYANTLFKINFVGHVHNNWKFKRQCSTDMINVGVDVWGYFPVTFETIMKVYYKWIKNGRK